MPAFSEWCFTLLKASTMWVPQATGCCTPDLKQCEHGFFAADMFVTGLTQVPKQSHLSSGSHLVQVHRRILYVEAVEGCRGAAGVAGHPHIQPLPWQPAVQHVHAHLRRVHCI